MSATESLLLVCATRRELAPIQPSLVGKDCGLSALISGVGPVEAACRVSHYLGCHPGIRRVVNFGVAGAYPDHGAAPLDLCVASAEILADFGICYGDNVEPFTAPDFGAESVFELDSKLREIAIDLAREKSLPVHQGPFLTVNGCSGSRARGAALAGRWGGICENMEGAAVARACRMFSLPMVAVRCCSNLVEDRNPAGWRLDEAAQGAAEFALQLARKIVS